MTAEIRQAVVGGLAVVGLVLLVIGLFLGFGGITKSGVSCGSAFKPSEGMFSTSTDCTDATGNRKPIAWALTAPGGVLLGLGCIIYLADLQAKREAAGEAASATDDVA